LRSTSLSSLEAAFPVTVRYLTSHVAPRTPHPSSHPREIAAANYPKAGDSRFIRFARNGERTPLFKGHPPFAPKRLTSSTVPRVQAPRCSSDVPLARVPSKLPHPLHPRAPRTFAPTMPSAFSPASPPIPEGLREEPPRAALKARRVDVCSPHFFVFKDEQPRLAPLSVLSANRSSPTPRWTVPFTRNAPLRRASLRTPEVFRPLVPSVQPNL
jgi:hypothetical protein